jgi:hypothetical protein
MGELVTGLISKPLLEAKKTALHGGKAAVVDGVVVILE